jgi:hypothetical protein
MKKRLLTAIAVLAGAAALIAACGGSGEVEPGTPASTSTPEEPVVVRGDDETSTGGGQFEDESIPVVTATLPGGTTVDLAVGTRCWGELCVDHVGPVTPIDPVTADPGAAISFDIGHDMQPSSAGIAWVEAAATWPDTEHEGTVAWMAFPGEFSHDLTSVAAPTEPGDYVLIVQLFWENEGDVMYGLLVHVE